MRLKEMEETVTILPRQQKCRAMNGAHLASPIGGEIGYAHRPQFGPQIHCPVGNKIWGPLGKEDVCPNFALMVGKFVFSNSGNFMAKANPPKPCRSCPKRPFGKLLGPNSSADWVIPPMYFFLYISSFYWKKHR